MQSEIASIASYFSTYSPTALKLLFDEQKISHILDFDSPNADSSDKEAYLKNIGRISLSGVQPKASLVIKNNQLVKPAEDERGPRWRGSLYMSPL